jgi:hypothetical protein
MSLLQEKLLLLLLLPGFQSPGASVYVAEGTPFGLQRLG